MTLGTGSQLGTTAGQVRVGQARAAHTCPHSQPGPALWSPGEVVPEMVGARPLAEAAAGHDADAGLLEELHAVEHVGSHVMGLREQGRT